MFKNHLFKIIIPFAIAALAYTGAFAEEPKEEKNKKYAAIVNGKKITFDELNDTIARYNPQAAGRIADMKSEDYDKITKQVLEDLIDRALLYQISKKSGVEVTNEEVKTQMDELKARFPDVKTFREEIKKMGLTEEQLEQQIREGTAIRKFIDKEFKEKIEITDKEAKEFYESNPEQFVKPKQVRASHILVKASPEESTEKHDQAKKKIKDIQGELEKDDAVFAEIAKKHSEGPSAPKGGDLSFFTRDRMVKPFADAAFSMKKGETSDVVQTRFGYHIIKVTDIKDAETITFEDIKDRIKEHLAQQKLQKEVGAYIEKMKKDAEIKRFL